MSSFRYNFLRASSSSRGSELLSPQKSEYDGVLGGGAPNIGLAIGLAPRLEDYAEIFGGRTCSIPLLELPMIDSCDSELHFDYAEVFGENVNGDSKSVTQMCSFQDLFDCADCGYDDGDCHPGSPQQSGSVARKGPGSSHGESLHSIEPDKQIPKQSTRVCNSEASVHCSKHHQSSDDGIECNDGVTENQQYIRFSPGRLGKIASSKQHCNEDYDAAKDKPLISVSDISLRTKPSGLPPPSRAPPAVTVVKSSVNPQIPNIRNNMSESNACREENVSESIWEMENTNKIVEITSKDALETLGKDDIWSSIVWDMEDVVGVEKREDSVTSPTDKGTEGSSISIEKPSDLPGLYCSTEVGERFVGIVNWTEETDYYEVVEGQNTAAEAFETIEDFNYLTQRRSPDDHRCQSTVGSVEFDKLVRRAHPNENKNKFKDTFCFKRNGMIIDEANEHRKIDEESLEVIPCKNDILSQLPSQGQKCKERDEETSDHGLYDLKYVRSSKEQLLLKVDENGDTLNRENGCFSPRKELYCEKEVLEADFHLQIDADKLEEMSNQAEEIKPIDKNDSGREALYDVLADLPSLEINGNYCNPSEATQAAVLRGNQTMKVKTSIPPYESQHVIDNPLFNDEVNRTAKTVDEDGTTHRVSKKTATTKDDGEREMKTNEFVMKNSVNSNMESADVRKIEHSPSTSEHNDGSRDIEVATCKISTKVNLEQERENDLEGDYSRKLEEERERERERVKDRTDANTVALEAREKLYNEKSSTEATHKAMTDARERLEKASAETRRRDTEKLMSEKAPYNDLLGTVFLNGSRHNMYSSSAQLGTEDESPQRHKARLERYRRTAERAANALAEKNKRDLLAQIEKEERNKVAELLDPEIRRWGNGKEANLRALLSTLQYILGPDSGWQPVALTKIITSASVKSAYRKATLCIHPDKLQQHGATVQQKYVCEKVFDLLKEAWNKFSNEERC